MAQRLSYIELSTGSNGHDALGGALSEYGRAVLRADCWNWYACGPR